MSEAILYSSWLAQAELVARRELSSRELVEACLARIERLDEQVNAFRVVYADRAIADAIDADARGPAPERPLHGVPVAIKDDVDVAGDVTAWGRRAPGPPAQRDAEVVARLRRAGAIVIGKTNVSELTIWTFTETDAYGATRNPWDLERTPGGSSGGSAAAVAAGMVAAALGSDGGGSIRLPAACCGLFGLKPQRDRIPLSPRREAWHGLSVNGPLTRSVADAAAFLDATSPAASGADRGFAAAVRFDPRQLRIACSLAVPPGLDARLDPERAAAVERTAELLRSFGHRIAWEDPDYGTVLESFLARYLRGVHDEAHGLTEGQPPMGEVEALEDRTRELARLGGLISSEQLALARRAEPEHSARINRIFARHDVVVTPALAKPPPRVGRWRGKDAQETLRGQSEWNPFLSPWNVIGQPAATVPIAIDARGLPVAVQLVGRPHDEATLLAVAAQIERAQPWAGRRPSIGEL